MSITIGEYLLARLSEIGIRHVFGVPGDFNLWFLEQTIQSDSLKFIGCCNELNAAYAADGYARLNGISALVTTYGVGELASLAGVAGAYAERVPMVCISGTPPLHAMREGALLHHTMADGNYTNMWNCAREFTVAQARIEPSNARQEIDRVLRTCWIEKRPVYLQLPSDVAGVRTGPITVPLDLAFPRSDPKQFARALSQLSLRLAEASAPAILLDVDADRFGLTPLIESLAEALHLPIAHLAPAKGFVSEAHPLAIGLYRGARSSPEVRSAIENSDCLLCIGTRFTDVATGLFSHTLNAASMIDLYPFSLRTDKEFFNAVGAAELLAALLPGVTRRAPSTAISFVQQAPPPHAESKAQQPMTQVDFWHAMGTFLQAGDVIVSDTGTAGFASVNLALPSGVTYISQSIWGALGYGLPAALGACLAAPARRQLLFVGDGGLQMSVQELSTILWNHLKPIIFLLNNDGYTIERLIYGANSSYNDIRAWRYGQLVSTFNSEERAVVHSVRNHAELQSALQATSDASRAYLIEVFLPRMDAHEPLVRFARRAAEFDFPQILED
ncbi:alpha-keto acid decarboxylase family protein [Terriglobus saanensis]|uniref:Thiamine pyrophosphate TPP-binding domain-containing protein n=1 Tax=Terriglobus saanensis (strain ATCC BAA-1853 / DSM 23119 / SP1PR4) TaxID=401053 RepID=E8UYT9_TERSS|nr:thiamine pyrophosphate-binding protein [Terriglobus saanensis]ADV84305.1 thiamine pyrophosphate TPP-binding domain-containing protein [Terriglobus saanensis SP1PR4]